MPPKCKSGDGCDEKAVMGQHGLTFCRKHGEQLEELASRLKFRKRRIVKSKPKPSEPKSDPLGRLPIEVRARRLAHAVHAAGDRITRAEAAEAAGLQSTQGSLRRVLAAAEDAGWVRVTRGPKGGVVPGEKAPAPA